ASSPPASTTPSVAGTRRRRAASRSRSTLPEHLDYPAMPRGAQAVAAVGRDRGGAPVVLVTEHDYAQVLGQSIKALTPGLPLIAIDQIGLGEGDFIDIGTPMLDGRVVPVSVKTLVFYE